MVPTTSWQIEGEKVKAVQILFSWAPKITMDGDNSHEIKKTLTPWKVSYDKLSALQSRDITFLTKVFIVKAIVFPVVMYGCVSWPIKRLNTEELMLLNCGFREDSWKSLGLQGHQTSQP